MRGALVTACVFTLLLAVAAASSVDTAAWKYRQVVIVPKAGLVKLILPESSLDASRSGLEDLRILDDSGNEIPYLVQRVHPEERERLEAKAARVVLEQGATVVHVETGTTRPIEALVVETPADNFIKAVRVDGSKDGKAWTVLASGEPIFQKPQGSSRLMFGIPEASWPYLKLTIDDSRSDPIPISGIRILPAVQPVAETAVSSRIRDRKEEPGATRFEVDLGARNLTVAAIRIRTAEPVFTRNVSVRVRDVADHVVQEKAVTNGTIFRVAVEGQPVSENLDVPLETQLPSRDVLLLIDNGASPPLPVESIAVTRRPVSLLFLARKSGTLTLVTGNAGVAAPVYDIASLESKLNSAEVIEASPEALAQNPGYRVPETAPELPRTGTKLDVSAWKFRKELNGGNAPVQQMELDPDVLSHARADFSDLRLMQGGAQVPYLIEHTSLTRALSPAMEQEKDSKRPGISRWVLKLTHDSLNLSRLFCMSGTALFRRDIRLFEHVPDARGNRQERELGRTLWVKTAEDHDRGLWMDLSAAPESDTLILETDNGDNPPLQLNEFRVYYPVSRLLFKTPPAGAIYLYYGNMNAAFPRYDIELVAQQLLDSEKADAMPGAEQLLQQPGLREKAAGKAGVIFWVVLVAVVIVLLFIVSRLLPKAG